MTSLTRPQWSRVEALLVVLELELGPAMADLQGHKGVQVVDDDDDGAQEVVRCYLPVLHVVFLLQQRPSLSPGRRAFPRRRRGSSSRVGVMELQAAAGTSDLAGWRWFGTLAGCCRI
jgi:hypothetical protein